MNLSIKNIENNIWSEIVIDLQSISKPVSSNGFYLIHYAFINGNTDVLKQILELDPSNVKKIHREIFSSICKLNKFNLILELVKLLKPFSSSSNIIKWIFSSSLDNADSLVYYFMFYSSDQVIQELIDLAESEIAWSEVTESNYPLKLYLLAHYKSMDQSNYQIFSKILELTNLQAIIKANASPIIDCCLDGFDEKVLNTLRNSNPEIISSINSKQFSPLMAAVANTNIPLIKWLLEYKADPNYSTYTSPLILGLGTGQDQIVELLLGFGKLTKFSKSTQTNTFDSNKWLPAHHCFVAKSKISPRLKLQILKSTDNLNSQNVNGNTPIHMMFLNDDWVNYKSIFSSKPIDLYIKNKLGDRPIDYFATTNNKSQVDELVELVSKGVLKRTKQLQFKGKQMSRLSKTKQLKLYNSTLACLKKSTSQCIDQVKNKISKLGVSTIEDPEDANIKLIMGDKIDYSLFVSRDVDSYIYLLYFIEKYGIGIGSGQKLVIKSSDPEIKKIIDFYVSIAQAYPALSNICIYWHDEDNNVFPKDIIKSINSSNNDIVFFFITIINENIDHANCLIVDKPNRRIVHFEPYGRVNKIALKNLDTKCAEILKPLGYKYYSPSDYLSQNSFQMLSNESNPLEVKSGDIGGFCLAWTLWFFELYLRNPKLDLGILVNKSINKIINLKYSIMEYIRFYANKLRRYHIKYLKKIKYPAEKIFNIHTTNEEKDYIYQQVNKSISSLALID